MTISRAEKGLYALLAFSAGAILYYGTARAPERPLPPMPVIASPTPIRTPAPAATPAQGIDVTDGARPEYLAERSLERIAADALAPPW